MELVLTLALIVMGFIALRRRRAASQPQEKRKPDPMWIASYVDGNLDADTGSPAVVALKDTGITIAWDNVKQIAELPFVSMDRVQTKTEEEIHRDVTLGRLLVFGVLAFGMKKKRVSRRIYNVIRGRDASGKAIYAVLEIDSLWQIGRASERINDARQKYRDEHPDEVQELPDVIDADSVAPTASNPVEQISRLKELLDNGAITQEEYDTKKAELLKRV
jgi:hypothetical protein